MDGRTSRSVGEGGTDRLSKAEHCETVHPTHVPARLYSSDDDMIMTVTDLLKKGATTNLQKKRVNLCFYSSVGSPLASTGVVASLSGVRTDTRQCKILTVIKILDPDMQKNIDLLSYCVVAIHST